MAAEHTAYLKDLVEEDAQFAVDMVTLSLKQLGIYGMFKFASKLPAKAGRPMTPFHIRKAAWDFWHNTDKITESTLTTRPPHLRVTARPNIQSGLSFDKVPVSIVPIRNTEFYEAQWRIHSGTLHDLYNTYLSENTTEHVSWGSFLELKPFYVRTVTARDVEMCCCKLHLLARWSVKSLVKACTDQEIDIGSIDSYDAFFEAITSSCLKDALAYIDWGCTPDKQTVCPEIRETWTTLRSQIDTASDDTKEFQFTHFVKKPHKTKKGVMIMRLESETIHVNLKFLTNFIDGMLPNILHHRNLLRNYRNAISRFHQTYNSINIDIDFSEKLKVPLKYEPQILHWNNPQVIVHSGILKDSGTKEYHAYLSDDVIQDHVFVSKVLDEMLVGTDHSKMIVIESDNCASQYKCTAHFYKLQCIANERNTTIIRCYAVAGHGKGEVDHVGGLTKVKVRREVAAGHVMQTASEMVEWLQTKFETKQDPNYVFKNFEQKSLEAERATDQLKHYPTVNGSSHFQVIVFRPNEPMKASPRICICDKCQNEYGSCDLFKEYTLTCNQLNKTCLRSQINEYIGIEEREDGEEASDVDVLHVDTVVALAASKEAYDPFYLIKITQEECPAEAESTDSWGNKVFFHTVYPPPLIVRGLE